MSCRMLDRLPPPAAVNKALIDVDGQALGRDVVGCS
jgi:hypothetical protein